MKKLLRMFWMMVLAMMMVLGSVGAYAADTQASGARAITCECGGSMTGESIKYGTWKYTGNIRLVVMELRQKRIRRERERILYIGNVIPVVIFSIRRPEHRRIGCAWRSRIN